MLTSPTNNVTRLILVHAVNEQNKTQCQVVIREVTIMSTICELMDSSCLGKSTFREVHQLLCLYLTEPMTSDTGECTFNNLCNHDTEVLLSCHHVVLTKLKPINSIF